MPKNCTECGSKIDENSKFCSECGKKITMAKKTEETKSKKVETKKKTEGGITLPKLSLRSKGIPIKMIAVVAIFCLIVVVGAAVIVTNPFDSTATVVQPTGGRIFTVTVKNECGSDVSCYITVDGLKYGAPFDVVAGKTITKSIIEDDLFALRHTHDIKIYATVDFMQVGEALGVTESADFAICNNVENGEHYIELTSSK